MLEKLFIYWSLFLIFSLHKANSSSIETKNTWLSSCRPCGDTLNECFTCLKDDCVQCVIEVPYTACLNCMNDLINLQTGFSCDNRISYQESVCKFHCRMNNGINSALYRDGYCDSYTGKCVCTSNLLTTTQHPLFNRTTLSPCQFYLKFENSSIIQVVQENVSSFRSKIIIDSNHPDYCSTLFRDRIKVKVTTKQYTAFDGIDFLGVSNEFEFNATKLWHEIKIDINDDKIIEPFEFFTVNIVAITQSAVTIATPLKII